MELSHGIAIFAEFNGSNIVKLDSSLRVPGFFKDGCLYTLKTVDLRCT